MKEFKFDINSKYLDNYIKNQLQDKYDEQLLEDFCNLIDAMCDDFKVKFPSDVVEESFIYNMGGTFFDFIRLRDIRKKTDDIIKKFDIE